MSIMAGYTGRIDRFIRVDGLKELFFSGGDDSPLRHIGDSFQFFKGFPFELGSRAISPVNRPSTDEPETDAVAGFRDHFT